MVNDNQIRWRCRRGTRELDILLSRFLDAAYPVLAAEDKETFSVLLDQKDPELFDWLTGKTSPRDDRLAAMVQRIRATVMTGDN